MSVSVLLIALLSQGPSLKIGDHAPALNYGQVHQGRPPAAIRPGRVTVVEFWATWCQPCIDQMPRLSALWEERRDRIDFVSVAIMENDWSKVEPFVSALKDKPSYPLVSDKIGPDGKGWMHERWFKAAGLNAIPAAMVVDSDSRLAWIGDPSALGPVLDKVLAGKWDVTAYRNRLEARQRDEASSQRLLANAYGKLSGATRNGAFKEVLAWIDRGGSSYDGPETQAALRELRELYLKFDQKDFEGALAYAEKEPLNGFLWTYFRPSLMVARIHALQRLGRPWREVATKASETSDPNMLMAIVDALTLPDSKLEPDPRLALDAAQNLARLARAPMFLLRLGWAHYRNGETSQALAIIDEALAQMQEEKRRNPQSHDRLRAALNEAKKHFSGGL